VPLAFLVLPLVKLLGQSTLGEQDRQDNEQELYWHNSLQIEFFGETCLDVFTFFQYWPPLGVERRLAVSERQPIATASQ